MKKTLQEQMWDIFLSDVAKSIGADTNPHVQYQRSNAIERARDLAVQTWANKISDKFVKEVLANEESVEYIKKRIEEEMKTDEFYGMAMEKLASKIVYAKNDGNFGDFKINEKIQEIVKGLFMIEKRYGLNKFIKKMEAREAEKKRMMNDLENRDNNAMSRYRIPFIIAIIVGLITLLVNL